MRIQAGEQQEAPIATPEIYDVGDRVGNFLLNDGMPLLRVQWDVFHSTAGLIGCFGSWRSGKTRAGALKILQTGARNPWRSAYKSDNPTSAVITETLRVVRDSAYRELMQLVPPELILNQWTSPQNWRVRLVNGHDIIFRQWKGKFEGLSGIGMWLDEAHKLDSPDGPEPFWQNLVMRASDPRGQHRVTIATGLPEYGWLSEIFDQPANASRSTFLCSLVDNFYLDEDVIRILRASTTEEEAEVVIHGRWRKPKTVIFYAFGDDNLVDFAGDPNMPVDLALDLGDKGAILVGQRIRITCKDRNGQTYRSAGLVIVDEQLPENMSVADALDEFLASKPWRLDSESRIYVDPKADRDELQQIRKKLGAGVEGGPRIVKKAVKDDAHRIEYGLRCVNAALRDMDRNRRLFVNRNMPRHERSLIPCMRRYKRKPNGMPVRDNIVDHVCDALRYMVSDRLPLLEGSRVVTRQVA